MKNRRTKQHICKPTEPTKNKNLQKTCIFAITLTELDND